MLCWFLLYSIMNQPQVYIYPSFLNSPPTFHPIPPVQVVTEHWVELPASYRRFPLAICFGGSLFICFTCGDGYVSVLLSVCSIVSFPCCVHTSVLYVCISIATLQIGSSVPSFQIPYIYIHVLYLFFSLIFHSV